jgi:hypothetical protein
VVQIAQILIGAFENTHADDPQSERTSKGERKRLRLLNSLASSILPVATSSPLWDLPTDADFGASSHEPSTGTEYLMQTSTPVSAVALRGNAGAMKLLLELVASFCTLLQTDAQTFLSSILSPIVERASSQNVPLVQTAAMTALEQVSRACGFHDAPELICAHFGHLMGSLIGRLRIPGGRLAPGPHEVKAIITVSSTVRTILATASRFESSESIKTLDQAGIASMVELLTLLIERFDHLIARKVLGEERLLELVLVCNATFGYLLSSYGACTDAMYSYRMEGRNASEGQPWRGLLTQFHADSAKLDDVSPREGFAIASDRTSTQTKNGNPPNGMEATLDISSKEIDFVSRLMSRCCYFLSHQSLRMRIASCDTLTSGFRFLAFVAVGQRTVSYVESVSSSHCGGDVLNFCSRVDRLRLLYYRIPQKKTITQLYRPQFFDRWVLHGQPSKLAS